MTRERARDFGAYLVEKRISIIVKEKVQDESGKTIVRPKTIERNLSRPTIRIMLSQLCALLSHAVEERVISINPATRLGKYYQQTKNCHEEIEPLTKEEVPVFLEAARAHFPDYFALFLCAIHTGMRSGELAGLQWADVDFTGKFLTVRRNYTRGRIEKTKTGQIRRVDLSDALLHELQALKRRRRQIT